MAIGVTGSELAGSKEGLTDLSGVLPTTAGTVALGTTTEEEEEEVDGMGD